MTRLIHKVSLMTESRSTFIGGAYTSTWITYSTPWANCQVDRKKESYGQDKKQQYTYWIVVMRQNDNVTNKNRLHFGKHILHVEAVGDPTARGRMIEVVCREEVK